LNSTGNGGINMHYHASAEHDRRFSVVSAELTAFIVNPDGIPIFNAFV